MFLYQINNMEDSYNANDDKFKRLNNRDEANETENEN